MNLLLSELNRFRSRRAVVLLLVGAFVLSVVITAATVWENRPFEAGELAEARQLATEQAVLEVERCERNPRRYFGRDNPKQCQRLLGQVYPEEYLGRYPEPFDSVAENLPLSLMAIFAFLGLLAGTTFVGADIASGAMSNTLLFRPHRWQVWAAKITTTVLWTTLVAGTALVLCLSALALTASSDPATGMAGRDGAELAWRGLRVLIVVVAAAVLGAAVTAALRSTIATVGVVIGYLLLGEALLRAVFSLAAEPFLASSRVFAFVRPRLVIEDWSAGGRRPVRIILEMWPSAIYLGVITVVVVAVCALIFSRRDVP